MNKQGPKGIEWRGIPGYEGLYEVSDQGHVRRVAGSPKCKTARLLKPGCTASGYLNVSLSKDGRVRQAGVHQLVAWAFLGPQGDRWVNHRNGVKDDNRLTNLEYTTPGENTKHAYDTGLNRGPLGEKNGQARITADDVHWIRLAMNLCGEDISRRDLQERLGVSKTCIADVIAGRSWQHVDQAGDTQP